MNIYIGLLIFNFELSFFFSIIVYDASGIASFFVFNEEVEKIIVCFAMSLWNQRKSMCTILQTIKIFKFVIPLIDFLFKIK